MQYCSSDFLAAMKSPIKQVFLKFEFYDSNMNYISEYTKQVTSEDVGAISIDSTRAVRRNFSFNLFNKNNEFNFGEENLIWLDKRVKIHSGLKLKNGNIEYIPQGVFILTELQDSHTPNGKITTISGQDQMYLFKDNLGAMINETTLSEGLNIGDAVKILANKLGITKYNFDSISSTIPYELTYQSGTDTWKAIEELSLLGKCSIYFDVNGYLTLKNIDFNNFDSLPVVWSYKYGSSDERFYAGNVRKLDDSETVNWVRVLGGSGDSATVIYDLVIDEDNPIWEGSPYSIQRLGRRIYFHNNGNLDSLITTESDALFRCKYEIMKRCGYSERVSLSSTPHYLLDVEDIIEIQDDENSVSGSFKVVSITLPLKPDLMTCECLKYRKLLTDWNFI